MNEFVSATRASCVCHVPDRQVFNSSAGKATEKEKRKRDTAALLSPQQVAGIIYQIVIARFDIFFVYGEIEMSIFCYSSTISQEEVSCDEF